MEDQYSNEIQTKSFEELGTTTRTLMCYPNMSFARKKMFRKLDVVERDPFYDGTEINKKEFETEYGAIYSIQDKNKIRGFDFRKKKKRWCPTCQITKKKGDKDVNFSTIEEVLFEENIVVDFFDSEPEKNLVNEFLIALKFKNRKKYEILIGTINETQTTKSFSKNEEIRAEFIAKVLLLADDMKFGKFHSLFYKILTSNIEGKLLLKLISEFQNENIISKKEFHNLMGISNLTKLSNQSSQEFDNLKKFIDLYKKFPEGVTDARVIKYFCSKCEKYYTASDLKITNGFLNQITLILSIGELALNIMIFDKSIKIVGCKTNEDATTAVMILWEDYISVDPELWKFLGKNSEEDIRLERIYPSFTLSLVMRNIDFELGFSIDRKNLNNLMNKPEYSDIIFMSQCEPTGQTNVNLKMYEKKPENHMYHCLYYKNNIPHSKYVRNCSAIKKKKKEKYITFIIFSSSKIIVSGRYDSVMKEMYYSFINIISQNKDLIAEKLHKPQITVIEKLKQSGLGDKISFD